MEQSLTIDQVAQTLKVSRPTIYRLINTDPTFETFLVGARRRMRPSVLNRWIEQQQEKERVA